jgi:hypothetical protein
MEKKLRSMPLLGLLVFSLLSLIYLTSCDGEYIEDYSFRNELNEDVVIKVYSNSKVLSTIDGIDIEIKTMEQVLLLVNVSDHFRSGAGADYICQLADSITVSLANTDKQIVFWRKGGHHYYDSNYKSIRDIFDGNEGSWRYRSIEKNHVEYYYLLTLEE